MAWNEIETFDKKAADVLVWNGERMVRAWLSGDGWRDLHEDDLADPGPLDPQPTYWQRYTGIMPKPPR